MSCIHLTVLFLSLSICRQEGPPRRLPGVWGGTLEVNGERRPVRAEFTPSGGEMTGRLHLAGAGDMTLGRVSESDGSVGFETRRGDDELIFIGAFREQAIVGRAHYAGEQVALELRRAPGTERRARSRLDVPRMGPHASGASSR